MQISKFFAASQVNARTEWQLIRTREEIVALQPELTWLAQRCGHPSMMDSLDYFLSIPYLDLRLPHQILDKIPYVSRLMSRGRNKLPRLVVKRGPEGVIAAALLFEHHVGGISTGIYMPINSDVYRTVVAPPEDLPVVAREVGEFLMRKGAFIVLLSYLEERGQSKKALTEPAAAGFWNAGHLVATDRRDCSSRLPLESTFDETLALMGQHTRRNLRAFQRRVVTEFGATYEPHADVSLADFLEMNSTSKYSVIGWMARWRYQSVQRVSGGRISGLRAGDGRWLSLIGSHSHGETVWLDWQMNREVASSVSLVSAMRAFFIATQVDLGMRWIHFEGGTPHSMKSAFVREQARDLLFTRKVLSPQLLKKIAAGISSSGPLATCLGADTLVWRR